MISDLIKITADATMRRLEIPRPKYQTDRISGEVNGLMRAYEIAKEYERREVAQKSESTRV